MFERADTWFQAHPINVKCSGGAGSRHTFRNGPLGGGNGLRNLSRGVVLTKSWFHTAFPLAARGVAGARGGAARHVPGPDESTCRQEYARGTRAYELRPRTQAVRPRCDLPRSPEAPRAAGGAPPARGAKEPSPLTSQASLTTSPRVPACQALAPVSRARDASVR